MSHQEWLSALRVGSLFLLGLAGGLSLLLLVCWLVGLVEGHSR